MKRKGERILGPYREQRVRGEKWRVILVAPDGHRESEFFDSKAEAELFIQESSQYMPSARTETVYEAVRAFCQVRNQEHGTKAASLQSYEYAIRSLFPTDKPLDAVKAGVARGAYKRLVESGNPATGKQLSVDSHRNYLAQVKSVFRWLAETGRLSSNPFENVRGVGARSHGKEQLLISDLIRWNKVAEEQAAKGVERAIVSMCALWLGQRAGEIVGSRIEWFFAQSEPFDGLQIPQSKTRAGERVLDIAPPLCRYLAAWAAGRERGWMFPSTRAASGHRETSYVRKSVQRICQSAGVPLVCAHAMRGSHATLAASVGRTPEAVALALGHASPLVTERSYAAPGAFSSPSTTLLLRGRDPVHDLLEAARSLEPAQQRRLVEGIQAMNKDDSA